MGEQFRSNIPSEPVQRENNSKNERREPPDLIDKTIDRLVDDEELMEQYIEKALEHSSLEQPSPKLTMKTMVLLYIEEHFVGGSKKDKIMGIFEKIVNSKSQQIFSRLWGEYNKAFPDIAKKHAQNEWKKDKRGGKPDWKKLAAGDKD